MGLGTFFPQYRFQESVGIDASAERVWRVLTDISTHDHWDWAVWRLETGPDGDLQRAWRRGVWRDLYPMRAWIEKSGEKWPRHLVFERETPGRFFRGLELRWTVEECGRFSRATLVATTDWHPFAIRRMCGAIAAIAFSRSLARLKEVSELE